MKVKIVYGPHFKNNINHCYDYLVKRYKEELQKKDDEKEDKK